MGLQSLSKIGSFGRSFSRKGWSMSVFKDRVVVDDCGFKGKRKVTVENDQELEWEEEGSEESEEEEECLGGEGVRRGWGRMLPELLVEIIQRVESSDDSWPVRKNVVACAAVCRRWREITKAIVRPPQDSGILTFPLSLKQPGPRDLPLQCFIKRNKKTSTFYLYLGSGQTFVEKGKFLMAARRYRHGPYTEYVISLDAEDISEASGAYVGKVSPTLLGTSFSIYDSHQPFSGAHPCGRRSSRRIGAKQVCPRVPAVNYEIGQVFYKFNLVRRRGPRRMSCTLLREPGTLSKQPEHDVHASSQGTITLKNKAPRWHEHLQCWCLNFHGRVTVASVKNFQLVAAADPTQPKTQLDEELVLLQFGKVGDDIFTMDYRQPLSAFQAFAISLTSYGSKFACE